MGKIRRKLARGLDMPPSCFGPCPYVSIEGDYEVKIDGCLEILLYSEDRIELMLFGMKCTVVGGELTMKSYSGNTIRIIGHIRSVSLGEDREV